MRGTLAELEPGDFELLAFPREVSGIAASKFQVSVPPRARHTHRSFRDIRSMIERARLHPSVQQEGSGTRPAWAVAGAWTGNAETAARLSGLLRRGRRGTRHPDRSSHRGYGVQTGAALPAHRLRRRLRRRRPSVDRPNLLRLVLGEPAPMPLEDELLVVETNIDDMPPGWFDWIFERLFRAGARHVWLSAAQMQKNRPAVVLHALVDPAQHANVVRAMLDEATSLGVRSYPVRRHTLVREERTLETPYGAVRIEAARMPDGHWNLAPEYDDCKRLAQEANVPLKLVYQAALAAARSRSD